MAIDLIFLMTTDDYVLDMESFHYVRRRMDEDPIILNFGEVGDTGVVVEVIDELS